jgi:hypothetical protein
LAWEADASQSTGSREKGRYLENALLQKHTPVSSEFFVVSALSACPSDTISANTAWWVAGISLLNAWFRMKHEFQTNRKKMDEFKAFLRAEVPCKQLDFTRVKSQRDHLMVLSVKLRTLQNVLHKLSMETKTPYVQRAVETIRKHQS